MSSAARQPLPHWKVNVLAAACALLIANLYYVQPIADLVATDLRLNRQHVGLLTTLPLAGYGVGLLLLAPLGDLVENKVLILMMIGTAAAALLALWLPGDPVLFMVASFASGLCASAIQVILPYTSHMLAGAEQGRAVAQLVSAMMLGIMLARPVASFIAGTLGWRVVYGGAASLVTLMTIALALLLAPRRPCATSSYVELMRSMTRLLGDTELLRRRAFYHAMMFGAFITFWTAVPLQLAESPFHLSQSGIAWVALAGVAGAIAPPFATRLVDAGYDRAATVAAMGLAMLAMGLTLLAERGGVAMIVVAAIVLDGAVSAHLIFGQRAIYALAPELRSRMNALYIACFFAGGAAASAISGWAFVHYGWHAVVALGVLLPALALLYRLSESSPPARPTRSVEGA